MDRLETPLAQYLRSIGLTQAAAAAALGALRGCRVPSAQMSQWCTGRRRPSLANLVLIAKWSGGKVPVEAWLRQRRGRRTQAA